MVNKHWQINQVVLERVTARGLGTALPAKEIFEEEDFRSVWNVQILQ